MLDTGSSFSWIQTTTCLSTPWLCNTSPKFNASLSSTLVYQPETIAVKYTEGFIDTQLVSDFVALGAAPNNNRTIAPVSDQGTQHPPTLFRGIGTFGLTSNVSGDHYLLAKETSVPGFLGASQRRFESGSETVRKLPAPVFALAFTDTWGTLTLGGPDPAFHSKPLAWVRTLPDEAGWVTELSSRIELMPKSNATDAAAPDYVTTELDRVWFDSGTTYIWGDESAIRSLNDWIGADPITGEVNCTTVGRLGKIVFTVGGGTNSDDGPVRLELSPAEYIISKATSRKCFSALNASGPGKSHWVFGLHVLRGFYTAYHYEFGLVGMAPYNITETNPAGKVVLPGSNDDLRKDLQRSLLQKPSRSWSSRRSFGSTTLHGLLLALLLSLLLFPPW
ncbi:hypothetical protein BGZ98_001036 [Dissophora globulifera]|nr:hypothetical protein BGZ98_001036 [Dissophora globulifera]